MSTKAMRPERPRSSKLEDAPVELERLLDVADLEGDVVQADEPGAAHAPSSHGMSSGTGRPGCQCE